MKKARAMVAVALAAGVMGAHAANVSGIPDGDFTLQGNFEAGGPTTILVNNSNRDRVGTGGSSTAQRVNQQIQGFILPTIPAGDGINEATFSFKMTSPAITGAPLGFDMVICLMNTASESEITTNDFLEATAPVNSPLGNGIVIGQLAVADVSNNEMVGISLTGTALAQLSSLYDASGNPTQSNVYFRLSTSAPIDITNTANNNDRFNLDDNGNTGPVVRSLEMVSGLPIPQVYYVAATPKAWTEPTAWSDGNPATAGSDYYVTNSVALQTPSTTATFPGKSLSLVGSQQIDLMVSGSDVITINSLTLSDDVIAAGVADAGGAQIDGTIAVVSNSVFSGATDDLRILSLISGTTEVELAAPSHTIHIDNTNNTFNGTWVVSGGAAEFSGNDAVGSAGIEVQSNGTLRILGDWQGLAKNDSLTVADSPTAQVDLGTYAWTVDSLTFGGSTVADSTYTAAELNALGVNPVFTGSGTLQIGPPPPPPQPEILVGWERWVAGAGALCPATVETNGIIGTATNGGFGLSRYGASNDGTFGGLLWPPASSDTTINEEGLRWVGATNVVFDFAIENTTQSGVSLGNFHFDALLKKNPAGPQQWTLEVLSGDITTGMVETNALDYVAATGNLADYDVDLTGLADNILDAGGRAVFRVSFTGGTPGNIGFMDLDNVAITKPLGPTVSPVLTVETSGNDMIISWAEAGFKLQTRQNLTFGDWTDYHGNPGSPATVPATNDVEFLRLIEQ